MSTLYIIDGPLKGKSFTLNEGVTTLGRTPDNDIRLSEIWVSRHHVKFLKRGEQILIVDLGSSQGVFVDGEKIAPEVETGLKGDSTMQIGGSVLTLLKPLSWDEESPPLRSHQGEIFSSESTELRNHIQGFELLIKVANILNQSLDIHELLGKVIDQIFTLLKRIDRGVILLIEKETGELQEMVSKTRPGNKKGYLPEINYSRTIVNRVIGNMEPVVMANTHNINREDLSDSIEQMNIMSVMCVPLQHKGEVQGVIYVDSIRAPEGFRRDDLQLLLSLSNTAAIAIENARMYSDLEGMVERRTKELKEAEDRAKESESRFQAVFEHMSSGIVILEEAGDGEDFIIKYYNDTVRNLCKSLKEDTKNSDIFSVFPGFRDLGLSHALKRVWKTGAPEDSPPVLFKHNDDCSWLKTRVYKLPSGEIVFMFDDITKEKEALEKQQRLQDQLAQAQKMESLGTLSGGVAHNFRNILQAIMGNSQFLQMAYGQDQEVQNIAREINESVNRGSDFVDSLLKFSRQESAKEKFRIEIKDVLDEIHRIIVNTFDKRIKIVRDVKGLLPVNGDYLSLSQLFINICNNARDAMKDGGELRIRARETEKGVVVSISDTGHGMDDETIKSIFDPFFTTKDIGKGTGLGLSTALAIVEEHNGTISVSSKPDRGTKFKVTLPLAEEDEEAQQEPRLSLKRGKGELILIVDDEPQVLKGLERMLKELNYRVRSARNGIQAIAKYKKHNPALVLLDWKMPQMDGVSCAREIITYDPAAKIIMVSGYKETGENGIDEELKGILKGFLSKPCMFETLSNEIARVIES